MAGSLIKSAIGGVTGFISGGPVGAAIGAGTGLLSGLSDDTQSDANAQAAQTSANATNYAANIQKQMFDLTRKDQEPWRMAGVNALGQLTTGTKPGGAFLRPFTMADYKADPGYNFRLTEGIKALDRSAAARGNLLSGAQLKGISRYGQDFASNEYQNAYNRYQTDQGNQYNRLANMAGLGQTANTAIQQAGSTYGTNVGNLTMANAANQGNAQLAAGQAKASSYQGFGNALGSIAGGNYGNNNYFNDLNTYGGQLNAWLYDKW